jgi:Transposase DDE domain group 1
MAENTTSVSLFEGIFHKPVLSRFDSELRTSDGGSSLLGAIDRRAKLTERLCEPLVDGRDPARVDHSYLDLMRQRVYSIALGYADCNDSARVGQDPAMKLLCGRSPSDPRGLASQPTLSRFEHGLSGREIVRMGRSLEQTVVDRVRRRHPRARRITIDLDPSVDPTHGQQPFAFFNGHYDTWCYLPMLGFLSVEGDPEQYLFHARLRPGLAKEGRGTIALLRRTVARLRKAFRRPRILIRLDAGFACPQVFDALEELRVDYVVAMPGNPTLFGRAARHMHASRVLTERFASTTTLFGETSYKTRSWKRARRTVFKAEVVHAEGKPAKDNARFVVTNLRHDPEHVWRIYCRRGDSENRIKELKNDLEIDRTSCTSFLANQLRVLMTAAAYVLYQELRSDLRGTELERSMVATLRLRLLKIGATITESVRRVVVSMPASHPWKDLWAKAASRVLAHA